ARRAAHPADRLTCFRFPDRFAAHATCALSAVSGCGAVFDATPLTLPSAHRRSQLLRSKLQRCRFEVTRIAVERQSTAASMPRRHLDHARAGRRGEPEERRVRARVLARVAKCDHGPIAEEIDDRGLPDESGLL